MNILESLNELKSLIDAKSSNYGRMSLLVAIIEEQYQAEDAKYAKLAKALSAGKQTQSILETQNVALAAELEKLKTSKPYFPPQIRVKHGGGFKSQM